VLRSLRFRRRTLSNPERVARSIADHSRLVAALEDRDPTLASARASANVLGALRMLEAMLNAEGAEQATPEPAPRRPIIRG
jgi:DNA-binding GntR family transcriptional regulator